MITTLLFDFSRVLLFPKDDSYQGTLNSLYKQVSQEKDYRFNNYFKFNEELLQFLDEIKEKYFLAVFTTGTIQNTPGVKTYYVPIVKSP